MTKLHHKSRAERRYESRAKRILVRSIRQFAKGCLLSNLDWEEWMVDDCSYFRKFPSHNYADVLRDLMAEKADTGTYLLADLCKSVMISLTERAIASSVRVGAWVELREKVLGDLQRRASLLDAECRMPAVRREPSEPQDKAVPLSRVEKRAVDAAAKLKAWQRKEKLAKGKVAKYRKKVAYYKKKGAT